MYRVVVLRTKTIVENYVVEADSEANAALMATEGNIQPMSEDEVESSHEVTEVEEIQ